jgi:hypothetical protein
MANVFTNVPVPAGNGVAAAVSTLAMGQERTITVQGTFTGTVIIQFSNEGPAGEFADVVTFAGPGEKTINLAAGYMRVRRSGTTTPPGTPNVDVAANDNGMEVADLPAPAGNGTGASVDVSALGTFNTVACLGTFTGTVVIEISSDGVDWAEAMIFNNPGYQTAEFTAQFMRVRRKNVSGTPGLPNVDVGAANDPASVSVITLAIAQVLQWGNGGIAGAADTRYLAFGFSDTVARLTDSARFESPRAGTLRLFAVLHNAAVGNGNPVVYDVEVNGVPSGLGLSLVTGAIGGARDGITEIPVTAGDTISVTATKADTIGNGNIEVAFTCTLA